MATSPREELVITSIVVFGKFDEGWVWAEREPGSGIVTDSGDKGFDTLGDALVDFFRDEGFEAIAELIVPVDPAEAHYSQLVWISPNEYHIRKYKYGAPNPIQAVTE